MKTDNIWDEYFERSQQEDGLTSLLYPLLRLAKDDPILRQLRPFTSHSVLRLSRCISFPFSMDCPWAEPVYEQEGVYKAFDRYGQELGVGSPKKVTTLLANEIPPHYVPAIDGTMYDLNEYDRLGGLEIRNSNLQEIGSRLHLERLFLDKTSITDDGLQHLSNLVNLQQLDSYENSITDVGLAHLSTLNSLQVLRIWGANISGTGFIYLKNLSQLRYLNVSQSGTQEMDLRHLPELERLKSLSLHETNTKDSDLEYIVHTPNLRWVSLGRTRVTEAGFSYLRSAKPSLKIGT